MLWRQDAWGGDMEDGVKILPPRSLFVFVILSLGAFYWMYGYALATPGSLGFFAFVGWGLFLLAILFWPNVWTIVGSVYWTAQMSIAVIFFVIVAICRAERDEIVHSLICLLLQWGSAFFLFRLSSMEWVLLGGYAPRNDLDDDEDWQNEDECWEIEGG
jgi:hypothetical protein